MVTIDFAVLVVKVLLFIWAAQLIFIGARLLERLANSVLRSVPGSEAHNEADRSSASIIFLEQQQGSSAKAG
jgi:O-antigen ligase